ncbi:MAG: hypothetical protein D6713_07645 [Deltaproteobacteria bacterium]|nr:MAG: hypothetical protein D6713_07645 [Deltaproteobacteria bacterium]
MDEREKLIREENRKIRFLRILVDLNLFLIRRGEMSYREALETVERLKDLAERLFPGKGYVFDIVYRRRFDRALVEVYRKEMH